MNTLSEKLRNILVQGWSGMLFLLLLMMLTDLIEFGMKGDLSPLVQDPGVNGLWFVVIVSSINVLVQISVRTFESKCFRWVTLALSVLYTLVFVAHQISHFNPGNIFDFHFVIDGVHHLLGIWTSIAAYRWAMETPSANR